MFEVCRQVDVDYKDKSQLHLLYFLFEFIQAKNSVSDWNFRSPNSHSCYWINHSLKKVTSKYPFLAELRRALLEHQNLTEQRNKTAKVKNLVYFREEMNAVSDADLIAKLNAHRTKLTKKLILDRCKYYEADYNHLKKKLDKKIQSSKC